MKQTIQVAPETKEIFEDERHKLRQKEKKLITQDEFLERLMAIWRKSK